MLKTSSLGRYWQDNSDKSSFTRVRCISTGSQATSHVYGSFFKARARSVPDAAPAIKRLQSLQRKKKISAPIIEAVLVENGDQAYCTSSSSNVSEQSLEVVCPVQTDEHDRRLLVCTLDTEQNERGCGSDRDSSEERMHSLSCSSGSVDVVTTVLTNSTQSCRSCGNCLKLSDMVVVFDTETYHLQCFNCGQCRRAVDPSNEFLVLEDGSPLCQECSPVCHSCGERIVSCHVNVLNKDFHEECLKCTVCKKAFGLINKVYATGGEPCCAECVTPVFNEAWSPRASFKHPPTSLSTCVEEREEGEGEGEEGEREREREEAREKVKEKEEEAGEMRRRAESEGSSCIQRCASQGISSTLPPRLESLSTTAAQDLPDSRFHSLLRPSFSVPSYLSSDSPNSRRRKKQMSLSSLKAVMYDELGISLLMNFCMEDCSIEYVVFWLDAEHFRNFDGNDDDIKLFAHHIMLKYVGYYAELPIHLPKEMEDRIVTGMHETSVSQNLFDEAQEWVLEKMEKDIQPKFLCSSDGQKYLEALVDRDITRRRKNRQLESHALQPVKATVISFDKRHFNTKYYVYEIEVEEGKKKYMIYRRYSDFHTLHHTLKSNFSEAILPSMPKKIYFGRSQTRNVAQQRMKELQSYLQTYHLATALLAKEPKAPEDEGILSCSFEVVQSDILRQFLTQTATDREDEAFNSRMKSSVP